MEFGRKLIKLDYRLRELSSLNVPLKSIIGRVVFFDQLNWPEKLEGGEREEGRGGGMDVSYKVHHTVAFSKISYKVWRTVAFRNLTSL